VPRPMPTLDGRWRVPFERGGGSGHAMLLGWLPGRMRFASLRPLHLRRVGRFIAQLHDNARSRQRRGLIVSARRVWGPDLPALAQGPQRLLAWGGHPLRDAVRDAAARLEAELASWPQDPAQWGWIHGDLHPWNLLFDGERTGAIDFSDAGWGFLAQDLAAVLQFLRQPIEGHADHRRSLPALQASLFDGYATVRGLPPDVERQVGCLHGARLLNTLQWMLDSWSSPADRPWGPAFVKDLPQVLAGLQ
jgi:Ser/Thr protein kinase RdoA (MazF antagonist)